jgi:hypothetical protein
MTRKELSAVTAFWVLVFYALIAALVCLVLTCRALFGAEPQRETTQIFCLCSKTCPHCTKQQEILAEMALAGYPSTTIDIDNPPKGWKRPRPPLVPVVLIVRQPGFAVLKELVGQREKEELLSYLEPGHAAPKATGECCPGGVCPTQTPALPQLQPPQWQWQQQPQPQYQYRRR